MKSQQKRRLFGKVIHHAAQGAKWMPLSLPRSFGFEPVILTPFPCASLCSSFWPRLLVILSVTGFESARITLPTNADLFRPFITAVLRRRCFRLDSLQKLLHFRKLCPAHLRKVMREQLFRHIAQVLAAVYAQFSKKLRDVRHASPPVCGKAVLFARFVV